ncbi:OPT oligopeptide transporter protein-domain-containing protein [Delphinella strobiligena]|nr:OPT oligopeptide transporter protein-domain-containing protein [Delphinella strobiligena]
MQEIEVDMDKVLGDGNAEDIEADTSPYPEVRAVVPETDVPAIPVNTLRMWILGIIWTMIGSGVNQFFSLRYPAVHIVSLVAELLTYPMGVVLAHTLPVYTTNLGRLGKWNINPDRHFNIKEHAVITIMSNVSIGFAGGADASGIVQAAVKFYGFEIKPGLSVLMFLCCQLLGFGIAGLCAPWLVEPASIIWPGVLGNCALLSTLHSKANAVANGWRISRLRFFLIVLIGAFAWYWLPGLMFVALSYFTWICWIVPNNKVVNQLFGFQTGLGLSPITFDWSQIAYNTNPLLSPSWAALNVFAGFAFFFWIVTPAIYYTNTWYTAYLPLMTADVYDNTGADYNTTRVLSAEGTLDAAAYLQYSPPFLSATFSFVYGLSFASITAVVVHVYLWHGTEIMDALRGRQKLDIHGRLMLAYKKTPWWWYATLIVVFMALSIIMVEIFDTKLPVYGVFLALVIPAIYMIPCGIVQGITNVDANQLNVLSEFIGGYMFSGRPLANMIFKILSTDVVSQGVFFAQDMKLGHYLKIAPRTIFFAQGFAAILGALTQVGVTLWMLGNIDDVCSETQSASFTCPNGRTTFSSSVIWGLIGPARLYSVGKIYSGLLHFFWIGALMPVITWALWKKTGKDFYRKINWPLIFVGTYNVPPATGINYSSWALVNWIFNGWLKNKFFAWWTKYNYVLAAALDTGTAISGILIFFCVSYPGYSFPDWWGNTIYLNTADGEGVAYYDMPASGVFFNGTFS